MNRCTGRPPSSRDEWQAWKGEILTGELIAEGVADSTVDLHEVQEWENGLREEITPRTHDGWYFDVTADDGTRLVVRFGTKKDFYEEKIAPYLLAFLRLPDGRVLVHQESCSIDRFHAAEDMLDVRMGDGLRAHGTLAKQELWFVGEEFGADLSFVSEIAPGRVGTGRTCYQDDPTRYSGWLCVAAKAAVTGTLTVGGRTRRIHGLGYHDHMWGTVNLALLVSDWRWVQAYLDDYTVLGYDMAAGDGRSHCSTLLVGHKSEWLLRTSRNLVFELPMTSSDGTDGLVPQHLLTRWADGDLHARLSADGGRGCAVGEEYQDLDDHMAVTAYHSRIRLHTNLAGPTEQRVGDGVLYRYLLR